MYKFTVFENPLEEDLKDDNPVKKLKVNQSTTLDNLKVSIINTKDPEGKFDAETWKTIVDTASNRLENVTDPSSFDFFINKKGIRSMKCSNIETLNEIRKIVDEVNSTEEGVSLKVVSSSKASLKIQNKPHKEPTAPNTTTTLKTVVRKEVPEPSKLNRGEFF